MSRSSSTSRREPCHDLQMGSYVCKNSQAWKQEEGDANKRRCYRRVLSVLSQRVVKPTLSLILLGLLVSSFSCSDRSSSQTGGSHSIKFISTGSSPGLVCSYLR